MIARLTGTLVEITPQSITLDVHGVGYQVFVTDQWKIEMQNGSSYTLIIHTVIKDDAIELYGFSTQKEKSMFSLLLGVPGIGPRTALAILGYGVDSIHTAITTADVDFFANIPRIGKKNAQKIIIELKSKLGSITDLDLSETIQGQKQELFDALISMGFEKGEIKHILKNTIDEKQSLEENLKKTLRLLGKHTK